MTPLHLAAERNQREVCVKLLEEGADVNTKGRWRCKGMGGKLGNVTARSIANQLDNDCVEVLMGASRRLGGERTEWDVLDVRIEDVPDWAREAHEKKVTEVRARLNIAVEVAKKDEGLKDIMAREGAMRVAERLVKGGVGLLEREKGGEVFKDEFRKDPVLEELFWKVTGRLRVLLESMESMESMSGKERTVLSLCAACGKAGALAKCGKCKVEVYCDVTCQRKAWKAHKVTCGK